MYLQYMQAKGPPSDTKNRPEKWHCFSVLREPTADYFILNKQTNTKGTTK